MTSKNETLFARAQRTIPGGVNSPVRAFRSVGGTPPELGLPKVSKPLPALTSRLSAWPW